MGRASYKDNYFTIDFLQKVRLQSYWGDYKIVLSMAHSKGPLINILFIDHKIT